MVQKKCVLLVDDDKELIHDYGDRLEACAYKVLYSYNGKEALEVLSVNKNSIDLVVLDMMMPLMNGAEFLKAIRSDDELKNTKVLIRSTTVEEKKDGNMRINEPKVSESENYIDKNQKKSMSRKIFDQETGGRIPSLEFRCRIDDMNDLVEIVDSILDPEYED